MNKKLKKRFISVIMAVILLISCLPLTAIAEQSDSHTVFSISSATGKYGDTVELEISVSGDTEVTGLLLSDLLYDTSALEFVEFNSFGELVTESLAGNNSVSADIILGYEPKIVPSGKICTAVFKIKENAVEGNYSVGFSIAASSDNGKEVSSKLESGTVEVSKWLCGDFDENDVIDMKDAVHFIGWVNFSYIPGLYSMPYTGDKDFNHDGEINMQDAVYLIGWINFSYIPGLYDIEWYGGNNCEHSMTCISAKEATCTEDGNIEYWCCEKCEKLFSDEAGINEIVLEDTVIEAKGHHEIADDGTPATTTTEGYTAGVWCDRCETWISGHEVIEPLAPNEANLSYRHYVRTTNSAGEVEIVYDEYLSTHTIINPNDDKYTEGIGISELIEGVQNDDGKQVSANGYKFLGWYEKPEATAKRVYSISPDEKGNKILYGIWSKEEYIITFDNSSMNLPSFTKKYTVDQRVLLDPISVDRYVFLGWTTDSDELVPEIKPGTTGNFTLHSNWTSKRNLTIPVAKLDDPIIVEDTNNGKILFTYEIGRIENVPLYKIKDLPSAGGVVSVHTEETKKGIGTTDALAIASTIDHVTTDSTAWTLSEDWNETTHIEESVLNEHGYKTETGSEIGKTSSNTYTLTTEEYDNTVVKSNEGTVATTTQYNTTDVNSRETWESKASLSVSDSQSVKYKDSAKVTAEIGTDIGPVSAKVGASMEASTEISSNTTAGASTEATIAHENTSHSKTGTDTVTVADNTTATTTDKGWNKSESSSSSTSTTLTEYEKKVLDERIAVEKEYGTSYLHGGERSDSKNSQTSTGESEQYSTTFTYFETEERTESESYTMDGEKDGSYRLVRAGIVHVFAVVIYDIANAQYGVTTYSVLDDETYPYIDYSATSAAKFDDNENGVLPFEVPYYVNDYVNGRILQTEGIGYSEATLSAVQYTGSETSVIIPEYFSLDNKDGTYSAYPVRNLSAEMFSKNTKIKSVMLSNYIREIPAYAFNGCTSLQFVYGSEISTIGDHAFDGCTSLGKFKVSSTVKSIGTDAFKGVDSIVVEASCKDVVIGAINSGAKHITINISAIVDDMRNVTLEIPNTVEYFELQGGRKTFSGLKIKSDAGTTVLNGINVTDSTNTPLKISSEKITLNQVIVESPNYVLLMTGNAPIVSLYGTSRFISAATNAVVCRNVTLELLDSNITSKIEIDGDLLYYGTLKGESLLKFLSDSKKVELKTLSDFEKYIKGTFTVSFDVNGGNPLSKTEIEVFAGGKYGTLPIPKKDYYNFVGWFTEKIGGEQITADTDVTISNNQMLYAHWTEKPLSDWVKREDMPEDADPINTMWKYTLTEIKTDTLSSLDGWTRDDSKTETSYGQYGKWSDWTTDYVASSDTRKVESTTGYGYYYYQCSVCGAHMHSYGGQCFTWCGGCGRYGTVSADSWHGCYLPTSWDGVADWYGTGKYYKYLDDGQIWFKWSDAGTAPIYRYCDRTKTVTYHYSRELTDQIAYVDPTGKENVSDVVEWVQYRLK